jgi:hypothetical protein
VLLTGQFGVGVRVFVTKCCSIDLEGGLQHLSNNNMDDRDEGISAVGGMLGLSYFLPCCNRR